MDIIRIQDSEFTERVKRAQALMVEQGIDVMFAFGNEAEPQFVRYLSDYWPNFETAAVIFGQLGDPVLLIGPESLTYASDRSRIKTIKQVKCLRESSNPDYPGLQLDKIEDVIESLTSGKISTVALAGYNIAPKIVYDELAEAAGKFGNVEIVRGDELIMELRMIKTPAELACMRKASEISAAAMDFTLENAKPGMTEHQIRGLGVQSIYENGGENEAFAFWSTVGAGSNQAISRTRSKVIQSEDFLHIGVSARYEGYVGIVGRSMFFGKPIPWIVDAIKAGYETQSAIIEELRAGNNAGNVAKAWEETLRKTGHFDMTLYGPCHATGLMEGEPPWIESGSDYPLRENMTFCSCLFLHKGEYGLRVEDTLRVGKDSAESLTNYRKEIFIK